MQSHQGKLNVLVAGDAGVGKSSLINLCVGKKVADVVSSCADSGTKSLTRYDQHPDITFFDTPGFTIDDFHQQMKVIKDYVSEQQKKPLAERVHVIWFVCSARELHRIDPTIYDNMCTLKLPVLTVFNMADRFWGYTPQEEDALLGAARELSLKYFQPTSIFKTIAAEEKPAFTPKCCPKPECLGRKIISHGEEKTWECAKCEEKGGMFEYDTGEKTLIKGSITAFLQSLPEETKRLCTHATLFNPPSETLVPDLGTFKPL